jgi:hypothetical protein
MMFLTNCASPFFRLRFLFFLAATAFANLVAFPCLLTGLQNVRKVVL